MKIRVTPLMLVLFATGMGHAVSAGAASFSAFTVACGPFQMPCTYGPSSITQPGAAPASSTVADSYVYVPPAGGDGGWSMGVNSAVVLEAPDRWHAYARAGGYIDVGEPFALNAISSYSGTSVSMLDEFTPHSNPFWNGTGILRFSWRVQGGVSIAYSAPGTPEQASTFVTLGFVCQASRGGGAGSPCSSPDFDPASPGSNALYGARRYASSQTIDDVFDFDVFVQADQTVRVGQSAGVTAAMGVTYGTPVGMLNGHAVGEFQDTGRLVNVTLFDAFGNVVPDLVLESGSGFDYLSVNDAPVPLPSTAWLMMSGLLVGAARLETGARKRRTSTLKRRARGSAPGGSSQ